MDRVETLADLQEESLISSSIFLKYLKKLETEEWQLANSHYTQVWLGSRAPAITKLQELWFAHPGIGLVVRIPVRYTSITVVPCLMTLAYLLFKPL